MLSPDEQHIVEAVVADLAQRGQASAAELAAALARVPRRPDVFEALIAESRARSLPWVDYLVQTVRGLAAGDAPAPLPFSGPALSQLLAAELPYSRKVEALIAAVRANHPEVAAIARARLPRETDPFVLATLASVLGHRGTAADGPALSTLLENTDRRVVANALDALRRLGCPPAAEVVGRLLQSEDQRVRTNALAVLAAVDAPRALAIVDELADSPEPARRAGLAYVLGELTGQVGAQQLLIAMLESEQAMPVLKQLVLSLKKHVTPETAPRLLVPLRTLAQSAAGARASLVRGLVQELESSPVSASPAAAPALAPGSASAPRSGITPRPLASGASALMKRSGTIRRPSSDPEPAGSEPAARWILGGGAVLGLVCLAALASSTATAPGRTTPVSASRARPAPVRVAGVPAGKGPATPFGPEGAAVALDAAMIGATQGRPIVTAGGQHFVVIKGGADLRKDAVVRVAGRIAGCSETGLFYLELDR